MDYTFICNQFVKRYGEDYNLYASPGRVNLIGEHTDYNGGFVFPGAIDKMIVAAIKANDEQRVVISHAVSAELDNVTDLQLIKRNLSAKRADALVSSYEIVEELNPRPGW